MKNLIMHNYSGKGNPDGDMPKPVKIQENPEFALL